MFDIQFGFTEASKFYILSLIVFMAALLVSLGLTPLMRKIAVRLKIIDEPNTAVKTHTVATPYMGGLAILIALLSACVMGAHVADLFDKTFGAIIIGMTFLALMGFVDDMYGLKPSTRFIGQVATAMFMIYNDIQLHIIFIPDWANVLLTVLWIVGITNALNIIDIMDGLASGVAIIAATTFFFVAIPNLQPVILILCAGLIGATLGFWRHNFFPAKIYMGDSGAYLIGFTLATIALMEQFTANNKLALLTPILVLGIPIYDTFLVMALRIWGRKNPFHGSRDHFALRLEHLGIPRKYVVILIYHICVILGMTAFIMTQLNNWGAWFTLCSITLIALLAAYKIGSFSMD